MTSRASPARGLWAALAMVGVCLLPRPLTAAAAPAPGAAPAAPTVRHAVRSRWEKPRKPASGLRTWARLESPPESEAADKTVSGLWGIPSDHTPFAAGNILVLHVFVNDPDHDWDDAIPVWDNEREDMAQLAKDGCDFIADKAPSGAHLQFSNHGDDFDYYAYETTISQRIPYDSGGGTGWVDVAVANIGFTDLNGNGTAVDDLIDAALHDIGGYEWGLALFHPFRSGRSYAAKTIGRAVLYAEDGASGNIESSVFAHEILHLLGATDEYKENGQCPKFQCDQLVTSAWNDSTYLNYNCAACSNHDLDCIMRDEHLIWDDNTICTYTRGHIGWRDADGDGTLDLAEAAPYSWFSTGLTQTSVAGLEAEIWGLAWSPHSAIDYAEYSVNGGAWTRVAAPSDGTWDEHLEGLIFYASLPNEGPNTITLRAHNADGNLQRSTPHTVSVYRDTQGPTPPAVTAVPNSDCNRWWNASDIIVSWQPSVDASDVAGYSALIDQWPTTPVERVNAGAGRTRSFTATGTGRWYAHVAAIDGLGNWGDETHYRIRVDQTPPGAPVIASGSHGAGVWSSRPDIAFHWGAADLNSHVQGYARLIDGAAGTVLNTNALADTLVTETVAGGIFWFHAAALDSAGNWGPTSHFQVRVDPAQPYPPAPSLQAPASGQPWYRESAATFAWNEPSALSGISGYSVSLADGASPALPDTVADTTGLTQGYTGLASGRHTFAVRARSNAGIWSWDGSVTVGLDLTAPDAVTSLTTPSHAHAIGQIYRSESAYPYVTVHFVAAPDAHAGTTGHAVVWDQSPTTTVTASNAMSLGDSTQFTSPRLATGHWYAHLGAYDRVGNWTSAGATSHLGPVFIDVTPPGPPAGLAVVSGSSRVDLSWRRTPGQGVDHFVLYRGTDPNLLGSALSESLRDTVYTDQAVQNGDAYFYRLTAVDSVALVSQPSYQVAGRPEYVTLGQGDSWQNLSQIVTASNGGVRPDGSGGYTMHGTVTISAGDTLHLGPGEVLRSTDRTGTRQLVINGTLRAIGTAANRARLDATWPVAGAWGGVLMSPPTANSLIQQTVVRNATTNLTWHGGTPTVLDCEIAHASVAGLDIVVDPAATGLVQGCWVHDCAGHGMAVFAGPQSTTDVSQNTVVANGDGIGWSTSNLDSPPTLMDIHDNTVRNNTGDGIVCGIGGATTLIRANVVNRNTRGIVFEQEGWMITRPVIRDNEVSANSAAGVHVAQSAQPDLLNNRILFNPDVGVRSTQDGAPRLRDNVIQGSRVGVQVDQSPNWGPDLGTAADPGHNRLDLHTTYVANQTGLAVNAQSNYWGAAQANPAAVVTGNVIWNPTWAPPANNPPAIVLVAPAAPVVTSTTTVLQWTDSDANPADALTISLFYDTDGSGLDGTGIAGASALDGRSAVKTFTWDVGPVPAGAYRVYGVISDGTRTASSYAPATVTVTHPQVAVVPDTLRVNARKGQTVGWPLQVRNAGQAVIHGTVTEDDGAGQDVAWLGLSHAAFTLSAGDSLAMQATFDAAGLADNTYGALVHIATDDPATPLVSVPIFLGVTHAQISVSPDSLAFAGAAGDSLHGMVTVVNVGSDVLQILPLSDPGAPFVARLLDPASPAPGDSVRIAVVAGPTARGAQAASLHISSDDPDHPVTSVSLRVAATGPALALPQADHDFAGVAVGDTARWDLRLASAGEDSLTISGLTATNADFAPEVTGRRHVAAGDTARVSIRFAPRSAGATAGQLLIVHDGAVRPDTVALAGWGRVGSAAFTDTSLAFGGVALGDSATATAWLHNYGDAAVAVSGAVTGGPFALATTGPPWVVAAGDSLELSVRFGPTWAGAQAGSLRAITGAAQASAPRLSLYGNGLVPGLDWRPAAIDFGPVPLNTARVESLVLHNPGAGAVRLAGGLGGGAPFVLVSPTLPVNIPAGDSLRVRLRCQPTSATTCTDTLTLQPTLAFLPTARVPLRGEGVAAQPVLTLTSRDFGAIRMGHDSVWSLPLENHGTAAAELEVTAPGAPFSRDGGDAVTVPAHGTAEVTVVFAPSTTGTWGDSLLVRWGTPRVTLAVVHLSGRGVVGHLAAPPPPVVADVFEADTASVRVAIRNSGSGALQFLVIEDAVLAKQGPPRPLKRVGETPPRGDPRLISALDLPAAADKDLDPCAPPDKSGAAEPFDLNLKSTDIPWMEIHAPRGAVCPDSTTHAVLDFASGSLSPAVYGGRLLLLTDDATADSVPVGVTMRVPRMRFATHDAGRIRLTVTDEGALGFMEATQDEMYGSGLRWPPGSPSHLYHGSLWIAQGSDRLSDASYDYDFAVVPGHELVATPGDPQSTACVFTDGHAPHPIGVTVAQHTYAFASAPDQDYVILDYALTTATEQSNVYVGLWLDADVGDGNTNVGAWLPDALGGFLRSGPGPDSTRVAAVALAGAAPCAFRFIHNPTYVSPLGDINDAVAWGFLTSGSFEGSTPFAADWSLLLAFGPLQLSPERATHVGLAVAAAGSEASLRAMAAAARSLYASIVTAVDAGAPPARFALGLPSPNPFNPRLAVPLEVPAGGLPMRLDVWDARGRRVRTLWSGPHPAGRHVLVWDGRDDRGRPTASGIYFVSLASPTVTLHRKVALVR